MHTGVRFQRRRSEHSAVAQCAQGVPRERTNQVVQVRLHHQSERRGVIAAKQTVHQGRRAFRAGPRTGQEPPKTQADAARPRTHVGEGKLYHRVSFGQFCRC